MDLCCGSVSAAKDFLFPVHAPEHRARFPYTASFFPLCDTLFHASWTLLDFSFASVLNCRYGFRPDVCRVFLVRFFHSRLRSYFVPTRGLEGPLFRSHVFPKI
jgi:hypothetical protein